MTTLNVSAGNTRLTATPVSFGSGSLQVGGNLVNVTSGADDFYQLRLNRSSVNFNLESLTTGTNVDFQLLDSTGNTVIQQSGNTGNVTDRINVSDLATGTYYLRVFTSSTSPASYSLNLAGRTNERFDLIWRNYGSPGVNGVTSLWTMVGVNPIGTVNMPFTVTNPAWEIVGSGDFNKDGIADLVWRNHQAAGTSVEAGLVYIWTMDANNNPTGTVAMPLQVANPNWRIDGVGDFNRDGQPDLVWRNYEAAGTSVEAGLTSIWTMNGVTPFGTIQMPLRVANPNWRIDGVGDFNKDGQADLVWRNYEAAGTSAESGLTSIWTMNGVNPFGTIQMPLRVANPNWRIDGVGDFNGDGQSDLVWRNYETTGGEAGLINIWTMNGVNPVGTVQMPLRVTDPNWRINGTRPRYDVAPAIDVDSNSLATALNIGTLNGDGLFKDAIGASDQNDYYRFTVVEPIQFRLTLDGLTNNADVEILASDGSQIGILSENTGTTAELINENLDPGTYYIRVYSSQSSTPYNMNVYAAANGRDLRGKIVGGFDVTTGNPIQLPQPASPTDPVPAGPFIQVNYAIENAGVLDAGTFTVSFYLSDDKSFTVPPPGSRGDFLLGTAQVTSLNAGSIFNGTASFQLPAADADYWSSDRTYFVGMIIDSGGTVAESNENNNTNLDPLAQTGSLFDAVDIRGTLAFDVASSSLSGPSQVTVPTTGPATFNVDYQLRNLGRRSFTGAFAVRFFLSRNNQIDSTDGPATVGSYSFSGTIGALGSGSNTTSVASVSISLPGKNDSFWNESGRTGASGVYYLGVIIDELNDRNENQSGIVNDSNQGLNIDFIAINIV